MIKEAHAQLVEHDLGTIDQVGPQDFTLGKMIALGTQTVMLIAGLWAFIKLAQGGFKIISSNGDPQKVKEGRDTIMFALMGLVLVLAAWGIIVIIETVFNIPLGFSKELVIEPV